MKRPIAQITSIFILAVLSIQLTSCENSICIKGSGAYQTESYRNLTAFAKIDLATNANVYLSQADTFAVTVEAQQSILDVMAIDKKNDILYIKTNECVRQYQDINIYISMPEINGLKISGSGEIVCVDTLTSDKLELKIPGSGNIRLNMVNATNIESHIAGSGSIFLKGENTVSRHNIRIDGSGSIYSKDLVTQIVDIDIFGSGNCEVHVIKELLIRIPGSGNIYYTGQASIQKDISGSGKVYNNN